MLGGPGLGILMPNRNKMAFVAQAIRSVELQSDPDWELVIVDDASTDGSVAAIAPFLRDPRIRLLKHKSRQGPGAACRTGMMALSAPLIGILDSDDVLAQSAVEEVKAAYLEWPQAGLIYTQNIRCNAALVPSGEPGRSLPIPEGQTVLDFKIRKEPLPVAHWKTFRRAAYDKTAGFAALRRHQDMDIVFKLEEVTKLRFLDKPLYYYRVLPDGLHTGREIPDFSDEIASETIRRRLTPPVNDV